MIDVYLVMITLIILGLIMLYCANKAIASIKEIQKALKEYKQSKKELEQIIKGLKDETS